MKIVEEMTWGEFTHKAFHGETTMPEQDRSSRNHGPSNEWDLKAGFTGAKKYALDGWEEGLKKTQPLLATIDNAVSSKIYKPTPYYDVTGHQLDIDAYCAGEPEHWVVWANEINDAPARHVYRIALNMSASCGVSANVLAMRGAATLALAKALELAGHGTEIWIVEGISGYSGGDLYEKRILLKQADCDLDLDRCAFALVHPATFRRLGFSVMELQPANVRKTFGISPGGGYGYPADTEFRGDIYIEKAHYNDTRWHNPDTAIEWVLSELKRQGITLEE
jgi:hypothetical protein